LEADELADTGLLE